MHPDEPHPAHKQKPGHSEVDWEGLRVKSLQKGGFGEDRVDIWCDRSAFTFRCGSLIRVCRPKLLHVSKEKAVHDKKASDTTLEDEKPPHQDERQIGLDTDRSFVLYPVGGTTLSVALTGHSSYSRTKNQQRGASSRSPRTSRLAISQPPTTELFPGTHRAEIFWQNLYLLIYRDTMTLLQSYS